MKTAIQKKKSVEVVRFELSTSPKHAQSVTAWVSLNGRYRNVRDLCNRCARQKLSVWSRILVGTEFCIFIQPEQMDKDCNRTESPKVQYNSAYQD